MLISLKKYSVITLFIVSCCYGFDAVAHDPTMPVWYGSGGAKTSSVDLKLFMTFVSDINKVAIINGKSYEEGETVSGYLITDIDSDSVTLSSGSSGNKVLLLAGSNN